MYTRDFDYELPEALIAKVPRDKRDASRLMRVSTSEKSITHHTFSDITSLLRPTDVLVLNNTKVIKARLFAYKSTGAKIEFFLVRPIDNVVWEVLLRPSKRVKPGDILRIGDDFHVEIIEKLETGFSHVKFLTKHPFLDQLDKYGYVPIPPYVRSGEETEKDFETQYQTVFAEKPGAVAAPTAGLHFTPELLAKLQEMGVAIEYITLHVGYGTFKPVTAEKIEDHVIHIEPYEIVPETAERLLQYKSEGRRIIAVGTTSVRTLESAATPEGLRTGVHNSQLFITPGYDFKFVDGIITNFHLPKSSLLMLVSGFSGVDIIQAAYQDAIKSQYRFYSFGDAMLLLP